MLRRLALRDFVIVTSLEVELDAGTNRVRFQTQATEAGKQDAERRFTVIGLTHREIEVLRAIAAGKTILGKQLAARVNGRLSWLSHAALSISRWSASCSPTAS